MVYSPRPSLWNRISLLRFCGFPTVRAGQGGRRTRHPPVEQDGFPFCHTHTHHVFVNVWPFYLPTPLLWNRMVFPFALRHIHTTTHTHTDHVSVYVWHSLSVHALLLSLRSILWCAVFWRCELRLRSLASCAC